jgi:hypothetical protein
LNSAEIARKLEFVAVECACMALSAQLERRPSKMAKAKWPGDRRPAVLQFLLTVHQGVKRDQWNDSESKSPVDIIDAGTRIGLVRSGLP